MFGEDSGSLEGMHDGDAEETKPDKEAESWLRDSIGAGDDGEDIFKGVGGKRINVEGEIGGAGGDDEWATAEGYKPWNFVVEAEEEGDVFDIGGEREVSEMHGLGGEERVQTAEKSEGEKQLEREEKALTAVLKGKFLLSLYFTV